MSEGTLQQVWETLAQAWWSKSLDVLMTENNSNVVRAAVQTAIVSGLQPTAENWQKVISKFAARLQVDTPRQPIDPEDAEIEQLLQKYPECTSTTKSLKSVTA